MADIDYDDLLNDAENEYQYQDQDIPDDISDITMPTLATAIDTVTTKSGNNNYNDQNKKRTLDEKENSSAKYACLQDYFVDDANDKSTNRVNTNINNTSTANNNNTNSSNNVCFKCKNPGHWAKDCPNVANSNTTNTGYNNPGAKSGNVPNCKCGTEAVMKVTIKDGPNKDRQFYSCQSRACNFFEWVNTNAAINTSSNSDSNNYKKNETFSAPQAVPEKKGFTCFKCNQEGHFANNCPNANNSKSVPASSSSSSKISSVQCFKCKQLGHYSNSCPNK